MRQGRYGFWRLEVLEEMTSRSYRRLAAAGLAAVNARRGAAKARAILAEASRQKLGRLRSAFPDAPEDRDAPAALGGLGRTHRLWAAAVAALADDNELDAPRRDLAGRLRATGELICEAILSDAEVTGRIAEAAGL